MESGRRRQGLRRRLPAHLYETWARCLLITLGILEIGVALAAICVELIAIYKGSPVLDVYYAFPAAWAGVPVSKLTTTT